MNTEKQNVKVENESVAEQKNRERYYRTPEKEEYEERFSKNFGTTKIIRKRTFPNGVIKRRLVAIAKDDRHKKEIYDSIKNAKKG